MRQKEIFNQLYGKKIKNIEYLSNGIDCDNLIHKYKFDKEVNFCEINDPLTFYNKISKKPVKRELKEL